MNITAIARIAHEINRAYCEALGDNSQVPWEEAPDWQKGSAVDGVQFHLDDPTATPQGSHDNWLAEKGSAGWKYGPVKDEVKKEHPCFVAYEDLPVEQKAKDYLFRAVVHQLKNVRSSTPGCNEKHKDLQLQIDAYNASTKGTDIESLQHMLQDILQRESKLNDKELRFVSDMQEVIEGFGFMTGPQDEWFNDIWYKVTD